MAASVRMIPYPKVGVPHKLDISLDGDTVTGYQWGWVSAPGGGSSDTISGATSAVYTPTENLVGKFLQCEVTFNSAGTIQTDAKPEHQIRKHTAETNGPRFRITRSAEVPTRTTSFERSRNAQN